MKKIIILLSIVFILLDCSRVPLTKRSHLSMIPSSQMLAMSFQQYDEFLKENRVSHNTEQVQMVKNIGKNIQQAVTKYLEDNDYGKLLKGYDWEFNLVEDKNVNAWCMPGGKVVVYTGILPVTQNEDGLAVVMGHEIAHAIARHGNERMSQELIRQAGGVALTVALQNNPEQTRNLWLTAYGIGSQVGVMLPFSRLQESEADHLGLIFMSMAGYNPQTSIEFWSRMGKAGKGAPPEFLSTHPSYQTRIKNFKKWLPEAMKYYEKSNIRTHSGNTKTNDGNVKIKDVKVQSKDDKKKSDNGKIKSDGSKVETKTFKLKIKSN